MGGYQPGIIDVNAVEESRRLAVAKILKKYWQKDQQQCSHPLIQAVTVEDLPAVTALLQTELSNEVLGDALVLAHNAVERNSPDNVQIMSLLATAVFAENQENEAIQAHTTVTKNDGGK